MKLKKPELVIIALTLVFASFVAGYFTGQRGAVNIVTIHPEEHVAYVATAPSLPAPQNPAISEPVPDDMLSPEANYASTAENIEPSQTDETGDVFAADGYLVIASPEYPLTGDYATAETPPENGETVPGAPRAASNRMININTASRRELTDLHGIGDVLAGRIVEYRDRTGGFSRIEDIMNVSGIGQARFDAIRHRITV